MNNFVVIGLVIAVWVAVFLLLIKQFQKLRSVDEAKKFKNWIKKNAHVIAALLLSVILVPMVAYIAKFGVNGLSGDPSEWGQMGDYFGGMLNPIFAFASFMALLYTIKIQVQELRLTRNELHLTRIEMARSAEATEKASEATEKSSEATLKASEAAASQLLLSRMQNDENIFFKSIEKIGKDVLNIKNVNFEIHCFYNGDKWEMTQGYSFAKKDKPLIQEVGFDIFIGFFLKKNSRFVLKNKGYNHTFRAGSHSMSKEENYSILDTSNADELKRLLVRQISVFERLFFSLNYALHTIAQMELYYPPERNFTLYYYSYLIDIIDPDFLALLAILLNHQRAVDHDNLAKFKFFERLVINDRGYIGDGQIHVINDLNLPAETYGVNPGYKQAKGTSVNILSE